MQKPILAYIDKTTRKDDIPDDYVITEYNKYPNLFFDPQSEIKGGLIKILLGNYNNTSKMMELSGIKAVYQPTESQKAWGSDTHRRWVITIVGWEAPPTLETTESQQLLFEVISGPIKAGMAGLVTISFASAISAILSSQLGNTGVAMILLGPSISGIIGLLFLIRILLKTTK